MPKPKETYRHRRLTSSRSIRVLTVSPSPSAADPLEVSLTNVSLDSPNLQYEALSYVWGSPVGSQPIICERKVLLVTPNCESALRHLRLTDRPRVLWIDAICIDQGNEKESVEERNVQITLMGEVYSKAARTLCWLGAGTVFTEEVFKRLERIGRCPSKRELGKLLQFNSHLHKTHKLEQGTTCLDHIYLHPWHSRVWTVQEVAFSADCEIVCGKEALPWELYTAAANFLLYSEDLEELDLEASRYYVGTDVKNLLRDHILRHSNSFATTEEDDEGERDKKMFFLTSCLASIRQLQATKPEDRIYGLYAAFSALGFPLPTPNYTKPLTRIYEEVAISVIRHSRSLQILTYACGSNRDQSMSSWVPDWQDNETKLVTSQFDATEGSLISDTDGFGLSPRPGQLRVRGKPVGTVQARSLNDFSTTTISAGTGPNELPILTDESNESIMSDMEVLRLVIHNVRVFREWKRLLGRTSSQAKEISSDDMFYHLLDFEKERADRELFDIFNNIIDYPETELDLSTEEATVARWKTADASNISEWTSEIESCVMVAAYLSAHRFCKVGAAGSHGTSGLEILTELSVNMADRALVLVFDRGLGEVVLGTAFHTVQAEDKIFLLEGVDHPVVLRPVGGGETWRYVGPAFVFGIMDGEAWSDEEGVVDGLHDVILV